MPGTCNRQPMLGLETKGPSKSVSGWHATTFQFGWDHLAMLLEETHGALLSLGGCRLCSRSTNTANSGELHGLRSMPPESPDRQPGMANIDTQAAPLVRLPDTQGSLAPSCSTCSPAGPPPSAALPVLISSGAWSLSSLPVKYPALQRVWPFLWYVPSWLRRSGWVST